jgi:hypothetical protein
MTKTFVIALFISVAAIARPDEARASCPVVDILGKFPIESALLQATVVFVGEVASVESLEFVEALGQRPAHRVRFSSIEPLKGAVPSDRIVEFEVHSETFNFERGKRVLVFAKPAARPWRDGLLTTACTSTRVISDTETDVRELRRLTQSHRQ